MTVVIAARSFAILITFFRFEDQNQNEEKCCESSDTIKCLEKFILIKFKLLKYVSNKHSY